MLFLKKKNNVLKKTLVIPIPQSVKNRKYETICMLPFTINNLNVILG